MNNINLYCITYIIKRVVTSPPIFKYVQGQKFLEKYHTLEMIIKDYSKKEIKTIFNDISKDQFEKNLAYTTN